MSAGSVYLVQPVELNHYGNTQCYKVGGTENGFKRCSTGYKKGSDIICVMRCKNPFVLETKIKEKFREKFKSPFGKEYFEGDIELMIEEFSTIVNAHILENKNIKLEKPICIEKKEPDDYLIFLNECTQDAKTHIKTSVLYKAFTSWLVKNNAKNNIPSNKEFMINLKKHKAVTKIRFVGSPLNGVKNLKLIEE